MEIPNFERGEPKVPEILKMLENHPSFKASADDILNSTGKNDAYVEALEKNGSPEDKIAFADILREYTEARKIYTSGAKQKEQDVAFNKMCDLRDRASDILDNY